MFDNAPNGRSVQKEHARNSCSGSISLESFEMGIDSVVHCAKFNGTRNEGGERVASQVMADMIAAPEQFASAREYMRLSTRGMAEEVARELRKDRRKPPMSCSRSLISSLETGEATRTNARRAAAIERVLKLPPGHLFRVEFNVQSNTARLTA